MGAVGEQQAAVDSEACGVPLRSTDDDDCDFDLHESEANDDDFPSPRETVEKPVPAKDSNSDEDWDHISNSDLDWDHISNSDEDWDHVSNSTDSSEFEITPDLSNFVRKCPPNSLYSSPGINIQLSRKKNGKRLFDKTQYCVYCEKPQSKLPRHLERRHGDEVEVMKIFSMPKQSRQRKILLFEICNKGNYNHNYEVIEKKTGTIIPLKRPTHYVSYSEYGPCVYCYGFLLKRELWKHVRKCPLAKEHKRGQRVVSRSNVLLPISPEADGEVKKVLETMNDGKISLIARNDSLIIKLGAKMLKSSGVKDQNRFRNVSQRMRELARLLEKLRTADDSHRADLASFINPGNFDAVVQAVRDIAGYQPGTGAYEIPSLCLRIGHSLHKCAGILESEGLRNGDKVLVEESQNFERLYKKEWSTDISKQALDTLEQARWNKPRTLPLAEDIMKLNDHLHQVTKKAVDGLTTDCNDPKRCYAQLAKASLAKIILFNRRRSGEASRITMMDYEKVSADQNEDIVTSLSPWERDLCKHLERVEIRGKRGRKVPVLLTKEMKSSLDVLVEARDHAGVSKTNQFLFALPAESSQNAYRGHACLREMSEECGLKESAVMTSTRMRKHVATLSQLVNLKDHELDVLATFLGHDIRVHREYYRLPESTLQVAKVSRLLMAAEKGNYEDMQGKSLDELDVDIEGKFILIPCVLSHRLHCI